MKQSRRSFIRQSALASTAFGAFTISGTKSSGKIIGANDRINVAVCGIKGRGASHIGGHGRQERNDLTLGRSRLQPLRWPQEVRLE